MRIREIREIRRCRKSIGRYLRRHKAREWQVNIDPIDFQLSPATYNMSIDRSGKDSLCVTRSVRDWQVDEVGPNSSQLSAAPYNKQHTGITIFPIKSSHWQVTETVQIDLLLSPAPYNQSAESKGANFSGKGRFDWQVKLLRNDEMPLPAEQNTGEVEEFDNMMEQSSMETQEIKCEDPCHNVTFIENDNFEHFINEDEFHIDNDVTEYDTELIVKNCGSESSSFTPELNVDGATSNCENEEREKNVKDAVLTFSEKHDILDDDTRPQLVKRIMDSIFREEILKKPDFEKIADVICSIYHCEAKEVYSNGYSGKLYDAYNKRLRQLRGDGSLPKSTRSLNRMKKNEKPKTFQITDNVQKSIDYLTEEQENLDVDECLYHWSNSFDFRQFLLKESNPELPFSWIDWKPLERSWSYILICEDFIEIHGDDCSQSLIRSWESTFNEENLELIRGLVKDQFTKENANQLPGSEEYKNVTLVNCLNAVLFPPLLKRNWRPSIIDAQRSVITVVQSIGEISAKVVDRLKFCEEKGMKAHPIIFAVNPVDEEEESDLNQFLVVFSGTQYRFKRFIDALDVCFKMFLSLHIPFPLESQQFYTVVNELFYKVSLDIKKSAKVLTFLQKIQ